MSEIKIVDLKANVLEDNDKLAEATRERLKKEQTFLLNLMSAPGSGKTHPDIRRLLPIARGRRGFSVLRRGGVGRAGVEGIAHFVFAQGGQGEGTEFLSAAGGNASAAEKGSRPMRSWSVCRWSSSRKTAAVRPSTR